MSADQLTHLIRHAASQGGDVTPYRYGHIATYDPLLHRVRCVVPSMTDQDGTPSLSGWMPLATMSAGAGFGIQIVPFGGATVDEPTKGEQCIIGVFDRQRGVAAVQAMFFHANAPPPATNLPTMKDGFGSDATAVMPGDVIIAAPPANPSGSDPNNTDGGPNSFIRLRQSGVIEIWAAGAVNADVQGPINIVAEGTNSIAITAAKGNITLSALSGAVFVLGSAIRLSKALTDTVLQLCNSAFWTNFNLHTHGTGPPPNQTATQAMLTQTTGAE